MQLNENKTDTAKRSYRRRKRVDDLMPELRRQIPGLYEATGFRSERVADDLGVSRMDVVDEYLRVCRKGPETATTMRPFIVRRATA